MKKILLLVLSSVSFIGCTNKGTNISMEENIDTVAVDTISSYKVEEGQHVFQTCYGDIDIDTMEIAFYDLKDSLPCYLVHVNELDSVEKAPGVWGYIYGPIEYYFCPQKRTYYHCAPDNHGDMIIIGYNLKNHSSCNPMNL